MGEQVEIEYKTMLTEKEYHQLLAYYNLSEDHSCCRRKIIVGCPFAYFFRVFLLYLIKHTYFVFQDTKES